MSEKNPPRTNLKINLFVASTEMVDALRLEASAFTPRQDQKAQDAVRIATNELVKKFGEFMPKVTIDRAKETHKRTFAASAEDFYGFRKNWLSQERKNKLENRSMSGSCFFEGYISAIIYPEDLAEMIWDEEVRTSWMKYYDNEEEAKKDAADFVASANITHETIHQFQAPDIPTFFAESGVFYYQRVLNTDLPFNGSLNNPIVKFFSDVYESLITTFGNNVHKIFYGAEVDPTKKLEIISKLLSMLSFANEEAK